ncbi:MAG: RDD family protein [Gemmatimonadota bacterium]|jgi:hypothetical protein
MPTNIRDPRSIITPDAFGIAEGLLGTPLAGPWRRFWAMTIDLIVIGILTVFTGSVQLLIWGAVALFFVRVAFQKPGRASQAAAVLLRVFAGCLGLTILSAVVIAFLVLRSVEDEGDGGPRIPDAGDVTAGVLEGLEGPLAREGFRQAETHDEVVETAVGLLVARSQLGRPPEDPEAYLERVRPDDVSWIGDADSLFAVAVEQWRAEGGAAAEATDAEGAGAVGAAEERPAEATGEEGEAQGADETTAREEEPSAPTVEEEVAAMSGGEVLAALSAIVAAEGDTIAEDDEEPARSRQREAALRRRAADLVAADTLELLEGALRQVAEERDDYREDARELRQEVEEGQGGFAALLRDIWDQAGSAIGLWSIYFTVLLTLWKGQTVGKKMMGVRVLRLDGEAMTWWSSFERGGGYVAGIATGLLGFAQVFWDPNRQCIHDKIVGTVVIRDGAPKVAGSWKEARGFETPGSDDGVPPGPRPPEDQPEDPT